MFYYDENGEGIKSVADAIREKAGITEKLTFPNEFISEIPYGIPKATKIKYIIPATLTCPDGDTTGELGSFTFTFTRENVNQMFNVDWMCQDPTNTTEPGMWVQHYLWMFYYQGNYATQSCVRTMIIGASCKGQGNLVDSTVANMPKTALSTSFTTKKYTSAGENYDKHGRNFKGLIIITDSTYDGSPIVDETKLSQFFTCDYITAGW